MTLTEYVIVFYTSGITATVCKATGVMLTFVPIARAIRRQFPAEGLLEREAQSESALAYRDLIRAYASAWAATLSRWDMRLLVSGFVLETLGYLLELASKIGHA